MYLYVKIISCQNVPALDLFSDSDVYCKITFQNVSKFTSVKANSTSAEFEESFIFPYSSVKDMNLKIDLLDRDGFKSDIIDSFCVKICAEKKHVSVSLLEFDYALVHILSISDIKSIKDKTDQIKASVSTNL